jgi:hypothetical protein
MFDSSFSSGPGLIAKQLSPSDRLASMAISKSLSFTKHNLLEQQQQQWKSSTKGRYAKK